MTSMKGLARRAGLLYLPTLILAPFTLMYIPGKLFVAGNATATVQNIAAHETLFRLGLVIDFFSSVLWIFIILALYRLLRDVDPQQAALMAVLGGVMVTLINFIVSLNNAAALMLVRGAEFLSVFDKPQRDALAMLFLRMHDQGILAAEIFWGLWLFPLAILVYKSRFLPRFLGVWLAINGFAYLAMSFTGLMIPHFAKRIGTLAFPALFGELALMFWLLIKGAREPAGESPAMRSAGF